MVFALDIRGNKIKITCYSHTSVRECINCDYTYEEYRSQYPPDYDMSPFGNCINSSSGCHHTGLYSEEYHSRVGTTWITKKKQN